MGESTAIGWTQKTFNPWRGCRKITSGCANCYMFTAQSRYGQDPGTVIRTKTWRDPVKWNREAEAAGEDVLVFTCSWSDFFISDADPWRTEAWALIRSTPRLHYQILTKRPGRIWNHLPGGLFGALPNVWLGVSVENRKQGLSRIDILREIPAAVRFLSVEPLLEDLGELDLRGIDWCIVGGESGPGFRPMKPEWARSIRDQCAAADVPFFWKQGSGPRPGTGDLDGEQPRAFPKIWAERKRSRRELEAFVEAAGCEPTAVILSTGEPVYRFFDRFQTWVNKAPTWIRKGDLCFDSRGRRCRIGADMMRARDDDSFPVIVCRRPSTDEDADGD